MNQLLARPGLASFDDSTRRRIEYSRILAYDRLFIRFDHSRAREGGGAMGEGDSIESNRIIEYRIESTDRMGQAWYHAVMNHES